MKSSITKILISALILTGALTGASNVLANVSTQWGYVVASDGSPLPNIRVQQHNSPSDFDNGGIAYRYTNTDQTGKYIFDPRVAYESRADGFDPGDCAANTSCFNNRFGCMQNNQYVAGFVVIGSTNYCPEVGFQAVNTVPSQQVPTIVCNIAHPVCGTIKDDAGNPVANQQVNIINNTQASRSVNTDAQGRYVSWNWVDQRTDYAVRPHATAGYTYKAVGDNGDMSYTWNWYTGSDTTNGAESYEAQKLGVGDCSEGNVSTGNICRCNFVKAPVPSPAPPNIPSNLRATCNSNSTISLAWDTGAGASSYKVSFNGGAEFSVNGTSTIVNAAPGTLYNWYVKSYSVLTGLSSSAANSTAGPCAAPTPTPTPTRVPTPTFTPTPTPTPTPKPFIQTTGGDVHSNQ